MSDDSAAAAAAAATFLRRVRTILPWDIVMNVVLPFTYLPQPRALLEDIRDYAYSNTVVKEVYRKVWIEHLGSVELEDKWWLLNNLLLASTNRIQGENRAASLLASCSSSSWRLERQINLCWAKLTLVQRREVLEDQQAWLAQFA